MPTQSPHKQQHLHAYGMSCMLQAPQQQSKNMQQQQSQQNALLQQQQPDKTADLAITATPTTQTQGQDVNAVYAEIVDNLRGVVQRLDKDGQSAALDAELKDQGQAAVSGQSCLHSPRHTLSSGLVALPDVLVLTACTGTAHVCIIHTSLSSQHCLLCYSPWPAKDVYMPRFQAVKALIC